MEPLLCTMHENYFFSYNNLWKLCIGRQLNHWPESSAVSVFSFLSLVLTQNPSFQCGRSLVSGFWVRSPLRVVVFFFSLLVHQTCDKVVPRLEQFEIQGIDKVGTRLAQPLANLAATLYTTLMQSCYNLGISV